jgi:hypothetical protein
MDTDIGKRNEIKSRKNYIYHSREVEKFRVPYVEYRGIP